MKPADQQDPPQSPKGQGKGRRSPPRRGHDFPAAAAALAAAAGNTVSEQHTGGVIAASAGTRKNPSSAIEVINFDN